MGDFMDKLRANGSTLASPEGEEERMSEEDHKLLIALHNDRVQALAMATQGWMPSRIIEILSPHNPNPEGIAKLEVLGTALNLIIAKYRLSETDQIAPDGTIKRIDIQTIDGSQILDMAHV